MTEKLKKECAKLRISAFNNHESLADLLRILEGFSKAQEELKERVEELERLQKIQELDRKIGLITQSY